MIIGCMRIKNESRWIRQSIESQLPVCDKVLIFDDHSTDDTREIVRSFDERCVLIESPFEGVDEVRDKNFLLRHILAQDPEWALWIDGDEVLEKRAVAAFAAEQANAQVCAYSMQVLYFWDSLNKIRVDGVYARFARPSLFRVRGQGPLMFAATGVGGNFHCGNVPQGLQGLTVMSGARIKHYGYLDREERQRKYEFYNRIDPNNESEDCYRHIIETPGARHAPGPTQLVRYQDPS